MSCSWENRAHIWSDKLSLNTNVTKLGKNVMKHIAIYNSFPFHYEMFGYIINYCNENNFKLTIFTETINPMGWFKFYESHFEKLKYVFEIKHYTEFEKSRNTYDFIFVTTDDDKNFKVEWINNTNDNKKYICIDHADIIRAPKFINRLCTREFINRDYKQNFCIPCLPFFFVKDKLTNNTGNENVIITIIGSWYDYVYNVINRLYSNKKIIFYIIGNKSDLFTIENSNIEYKLFKNIDTFELYEILKISNYILVDCTTNKRSITGESMSGSVPLAFSSLTPLIISKQNNSMYKFKNVLEFDLLSDDKILLDDFKVDYNEIIIERNHITSMLTNYMNKTFLKTTSIQPKNKIPKKIFQTWITKNLEPEFQKIVDTWKIFNPEYEYTLFDNADCELFIKENFDENTLNTYNSIVPGAYKSDFWRYCILYKYGGVYVDIDTICMGKLSDFIKDEIFVAPIDLNINPFEGNYNLFNTFIAVVPGSKIMLECINRIVKNVQGNIIPNSKLDFSGPGLLGRSVNTFLGLPETNSFIGKEGTINIIYGAIKFLKFEPKIEYVKDLVGNILFQNKNGNQQIIDLYNIECKKIQNHICWVNCPSDKIIKQTIENVTNTEMLYSNFFDRRKTTFLKSFELILKNINSQNTYNIVEFGTSRSFVNGNIEGCLSTDIKFWYPNNPEKWDWGAGVFTKVFSDNLCNLNYKLCTIDPSKEAIHIVNTMIDNKVKSNVNIINDYSTNFLKNIDFKIDFLYMDHMESCEQACVQHYTDSKYIVENNIMNDNSFILIDDCGCKINKSKYSVPYLLDNGFEMIINDYQILLKKTQCKNTALIVEPRDIDCVVSLIEDYRQKLGESWIIVFYCGKGLKQKWTQLLLPINNVISDIEVRELDVNNLSPYEYSDLFKSKTLWNSLYGKFVLTFQLDAYILNKLPYNIDYFIKMDKSYIGGNTCYVWNESKRENIHFPIHNGNGGLSLRKRNDMIKIIDHFGSEKNILESTKIQTDTEDVYFVHGCYKLNLPLGNDEPCQHFAIHSIYKEPYFGIHNPCTNVLKNIKGISDIYCKIKKMFNLKF